MKTRSINSNLHDGQPPRSRAPMNGCAPTGLQVARPFLRWAGSKRQHIPFLRDYWSPERANRYVEPFAGSAALFFAIAPSRAILGDLNGDLIRTFRAIQRDPETVYRALAKFKTGREHYYRVRAMPIRYLDEPTKAARFVYLNRFCFNGLYRTNAQGGFNVPYGAPRNGNLPDLEQLRICALLLSHARLINADFRRTLSAVDAGDFVYLDPPYAVSRRRVFVEYGRVTFSTDDLEELAECLIEVHRRGATFVLSYADSRESRRLLGRWPRRRFAVRRNMAGFAGARRNHYELFISNIAGF
jgi:DNA adenine methylase